MHLRNLNRISWPLIYLYIKPLLQQQNITRWDNLVLKTNFRNLIQILPRSVFLLNPLGLLWARFLYKFLKKCQHSTKATFKRVKSQIQKGADPERAARRGYENACDYFEIMNKRILIQQRVLACLSKSVAHVLQREL